MRLPTFIGIGAQRAATTWAYVCLKEHPEVFMAPEKEIHYFDENYDKGSLWYGSHFQNAELCNPLAIGEITPNYLNVPVSIQRIAKDIPKIKLFAVLREPISRAYSAYKLLHEKFGEMTFQEACEKTSYFLELSCYAKDLRGVFEYFDKSSVKIFLYEDVCNRPLEVLTELYSFIGVDPSFKPKALNTTYNSIIMPDLQKKLEKLRLTFLVNAFKNTSVGRKTKNLLINFTNKSSRGSSSKNESVSACSDPIGADYRRQLQEYFRADIIATQNLIGRDLSHWL